MASTGQASWQKPQYMHLVMSMSYLQVLQVSETMKALLKDTAWTQFADLPRNEPAHPEHNHTREICSASPYRVVRRLPSSLSSASMVIARAGQTWAAQAMSAGCLYVLLICIALFMSSGHQRAVGERAVETLLLLKAGLRETVQSVPLHRACRLCSAPRQLGIAEGRARHVHVGSWHPSQRGS